MDSSYRYDEPSSKNTSKRTTHFSDQDEYVEVTLDINDDHVAIHGAERALLGGSYVRAPPATSGMHGAGGGGGLASKLKQVGTELRKITSTKRGEMAPAPPPPGRKLDRSMTTAAKALKGMQFLSDNMVTQGWPEVEKRFEKLAVDGVLLRSRFGQCIGMTGSDEFAGQVFDALARRRGISAQLLTKDQVREFWQQLMDRGFDARLQTFFDMVDKNADGRITEEEVKEILTLTASANKLTKILERVDEYTALIMEELDPNHLGYIELENLEMLLLQPQVQTAKLTHNSSNISQLISQKLVPTRDRNPLRRLWKWFKYFMEDNWKRVWVMGLWLTICVGLFTWKFIYYKSNPTFQVMGYCVCIAKGGAETTKLNMAIVLLPVCRNLVTWLRSKTKLGTVVPFNDNLNFHKTIAWGVAVGAGLHIIPHLICDFPRILHETDYQYYTYLAQFFGPKRPPNYWWFVKGVEGVTGLIITILMVIAYIFAQPWFRRSKMQEGSVLWKLSGFNTFWYSHHLFVIVYIVFIWHGETLYINRKFKNKTTWMYLLIPLTLYVGERILRALRSGYKPVKIQKVAVYPGNVIAIYMHKPHNFKYKSGQYMFVNCSAISPFEWHPFTITSAPGEDNLSMHIRCRGDWTSSLRSIFAEKCRPPAQGQSGLLRADVMTTERTAAFPNLLIDGPYGAPAQDYWKYNVLLLIGLGIGATPLISIMKDVLNNTQKQRDGSMSLAELERKSKTFMTERVYFYWVTREEGSFEWFRGVMNEVAEKDKDGVIELHNHCTSVYEEGDARSALIIMLQALNHAKHGVDIVSGTRVKTHFARPNWRTVFKHVAVNHEKQRVGVFYCGDQTLTPELRKLSQDFTHKTSTKFVFHKENF
ncbi:hypothetical protein LUZ61_017672 [Rhynchospora tenuis]|uniref:Uncharacterized protein n=1 Tax=Rhynchospora tenuis TaxID=198213 RepID=A0AAD5Z7T8_9POAL|nr:hypothetical protein LUZ61_017672 [Rhynchospora tenuis]